MGVGQQDVVDAQRGGYGGRQPCRDIGQASASGTFGMSRDVERFTVILNDAM